MRTRHEWQQARFTGNTTCLKCGLLPLDEDDYQSPCDEALLGQTEEGT